MSAGRGLLVLSVLLASCGGSYPRVTVVNACGGTLSGGVLTLEEGTAYAIGRLEAGEKTTVVVEPRGESDVTLDYTDPTGIERTVSGGYLEETGSYHLTLTVGEQGVVDFDVNLD